MKNIFKKPKTIYWRVKSFIVRYYYGNPAKKLKIDNKAKFNLIYFDRVDFYGNFVIYA